MPDWNSETSTFVCKSPQGLDLIVFFRELLTHSNKIRQFTPYCSSCCFLFKCCYYHYFIFLVFFLTCLPEFEPMSAASQNCTATIKL